MQNTPRINLKKFECRLVNSFGDGHNHELEQYKTFCGSMERIAATKGFEGILLGNVYCDNVSLDSLLLTSFGVFVIEFKNYTKVAGVKITGQKEFQCMNIKGDRMILPDGNFLNVKGGSLSSPYDQAKKNRIAVFNTLKRLFGEEKASTVHVGVAIVFNGKLVIEGIENIIESERRWLTVVDSVGFEQFMAYVAGEGTKGLNASDREAFINHMDANASIPIKVDMLKQAQEYYDMGLYETACRKALSCDSTNPVVMQLVMQALFRSKKKDFKMFQDLLVLARNTENPMLVKTANKLVGLSLLKGCNGFPKNEDRALEYLLKADRNDKEVVMAVIGIKQNIEFKQKQEEIDRKKEMEAEAMQKAWEMENKREMAFNSKTRQVLADAGRDYLEVARIAMTSLIIMTVFFMGAALMPDNGIKWYLLALICSACFILGVIWWVGEKGSDKVWLIRKKTLRHTRNLTFHAVSVRSESFLKGDRLYKTILYVAVIFIYFGLPVYVWYRIVKVGIMYLMKLDLIHNFVDSIRVYSSIDPIVTLHSFLLVYCILSLLAIVYPVIRQLTDGFGFFSKVYDGKDYCYRIALPNLKKDASYKFESIPILLCKDSFLFSVGLTTASCFLGWIKPLLYKIFSILF